MTCVRLFIHSDTLQRKQKGHEHHPVISPCILLDERGWAQWAASLNVKAEVFQGQGWPENVGADFKPRRMMC